MIRWSARHLVFLLLFFSLPQILPAVNLNRIYPVDSDVYRALEQMYIEQGYAIPSTSGPWSADELLRMLNRLDQSQLSPEQQSLADRVEAELRRPLVAGEGESVLFEFDLEVNLEAYIQATDNDFFRTEERRHYDYTDRSYMINVPLEVWAASPFYGYFELGLLASRYDGYFSEPFVTNLVDQDTIGWQFPVRGFVVAGGDHWTLQFGRDQISWGPGRTGNLIISDNFDYHEFLRFATYHDRFKFSTMISTFSHPAWYYGTGDDDEIGDDEILEKWYDPDPFIGRQDDERQGFQAFIAHRLEFRPVDRFAVAISESMMYMGDDFDLRFLNPAMLYHNIYMRGNSKSLLGFDMEFGLAPGYNTFLSFVIDDSGLVDNPRAVGLLTGVRGSRMSGPGSLWFNLEGAYTDPYFYLRNPPEREQRVGPFPIDYTASIYQFGHSFGPEQREGLLEVRRFLGYRYGNDVALLQAEAGYDVFGQWQARAGIMGLFEGTMDMHSQWHPDGSSDLGPTSEHPPHDFDPGDPEARDAIQSTLLLDAGGRYQLTDWLSLFGHTAFQYTTNIRNRSDGGSGTSLQLSLGANLAF